MQVINDWLEHANIMATKMIESRKEEIIDELYLLGVPIDRDLKVVIL